MKTKETKDKVNVITLGCSKNLVDSENIITQLQANDITAEHEKDGDEANVIIVNTCGFIETAKEESINTILTYADEKIKGNIDKLFVTGCLSHRYKEDLEKEIPEVDAYFGTMELPGLLSRFNVDYQHELIGERRIATLSHYAYLKISEGCNRTCSFCAIPLMRGDHVSKPIEDVITEAKNLVRSGVKEIMLIAQELTYYGLDIYKKRALPDLLVALESVEGLDWLRLHYAYPSKFPKDIFDVMATSKNLCHYLDIPLQHANDAVLHRMKRQITQAEMVELITHARQVVPDIHIRTTLLVGFPGETEEEFQDLCDFIESQQFERLGVFQYSHEEGTSAYNLVDDVPDEVKAERASRIMEIQQAISYQKNRTKIGQEYKVLIDRKEGGYYYGRTKYDSPDVDNEVLIDATEHYARIGDFAQVKIIDAQEYDLIAKVLL